MFDFKQSDAFLVILNVVSAYSLKRGKLQKNELYKKNIQKSKPMQE